MDVAALLRQRFDEYGTARDAWGRNQFNPELTVQEHQECYNALQAAQNNLNFMMDNVRQHELLILSTLNQARAFVSLLKYFLFNRGFLNRVQIGGNMSHENRAEVRRWLENGGLTLQQTNLIFLFPPPQ